MFNLGPMEMVVLAIVGIVVIGPEKLPGLARDAAGLLRTLRDLATGARQQLHDELGPEFADMDLRNLNPRTAAQRMIFGDDTDLTKFSPRGMVRDAVFGDGDMDDLRSADPRTVLRDAKASYKASWADGVSPSANGAVDMSKPAPSSDGPRPRPRPRPSYGDDVT